MWIATQENPASPPSLASQSLCLKLDTLSSDESEAGTGGVPVVEPIVISDQELTVISVHFGDPDPDLLDEDRPSSVRIELSAVSFVLISPNRVRKDCSSGSLDKDPVLHTTVPAAPEPFDISLPPTGAESCLPLMMDGSDVSLVTIPVYPLPAGVVLMPVPPSDQPSSSPIRLSRWELS